MKYRQILAIVTFGVFCLTSILGMAACKSDGLTKTINQTTTLTKTLTTTVPGPIVTVTQEPVQPTNTIPAGTKKTITDMFGREVVVPSVVNKVLTCGPVEMELVYMLAPDKVDGLNFTFNGNPPFAHGKYTSLPVVGGWFGTQTGNYETFIAAMPDIIIDGNQVGIEERQSKFGEIPVVGVDTGDLMFDYKEAARFLGELLGVEEKANALIDYYEEAMLYVYGVVSDIPENERVRVYYAGGKEGFNTDPLGSQHTMLMDFCGGINVADVTLLPGYGMAEASMEQILLWDPDLIIIGRGSQANLYQSIMNDQRWAGLKAVQDEKVFLRPDNPFSWFDGPPGPCQILGMYWMVNLLYPDQTQDLDLNTKVKEFYSDYLHYDLTSAEIESLLPYQN
ncbi:MAG: ABC transporter substrate-binding protein [Dehalococcoidales bacterium]|nr:ABC transporter substrate-binding protein [Dehalococcoidales bacterium]